MPPERLPPDTPAEWLNRARSDLAIARTAVPGAYWEDLCYHAQQAAEKAFKGLLLKRAGSFPYTHDLADLIGRLQETRVLVPDHIMPASSLTLFAVEGRYPGLNEPLTEDEWRAAVAMAEQVVEWAAALLSPPRASAP